MREAFSGHMCGSSKGRRRVALALMVVVPAILGSGDLRAGVPVLLDEVVAVVAGKFQGGVPPRVMTRWDLEAECRLESIQRYGAGGVGRSISKSLRATVLERMVDESVIFREAVRLDGAQVEEETVDEAFAQVAQVAGSKEEFLTLLEEALLTEEKVRSILARRIVADRYVLDSLRLTMSFTESEIEGAFGSMDHPFTGKQLDEVHDEFLDHLVEVMAHQHRDELIEGLSARCHIWVFYKPVAPETG